MRAITVRFEIVQRTGLEVEFDETYVAADQADALRQAEEYRTVKPEPLVVNTRIVADDQYESRRIYPRKNWCLAHRQPIVRCNHLQGQCVTDASLAAVWAAGSVALLEDKA